eukprot:TRINITY_DN61259_c0_g2_i1.p1 TRINITY_DN61259_c0_g2~~TRINITY_DN61259_c0_g2_i1.p1  ORF type:complete len:334 (+),score=18.24 TRINITY_DN61259_c0_g2_i1:24-1004(+)
MPASSSRESGYGQLSLHSDIVKYHNTPADGWVTMDGNVYDITLFLDQHPGGAKVLVPYLGKDITQAMKGETETGTHSHSDFAYELLDKYKLGKCSKEKPVGVKVDWSKPILRQVGGMGDKYHKWVHSFPTTDHTIRLFESDFLEWTSKCAWFVPLVFWVPILISFSLYLLLRTQQPIYRMAPLMAVGFVCWLLFEYLLHKYVFHLHTSTAKWNIFHFLAHGLHHVTPADNLRLVFPPIPATILASPVIAIGLLGFGLCDGLSMLVGFGIGYLSYDMTHYHLHHTVPKNTFMRSQKSRHMHHHYKNPNCNFGISNPLFDLVFKTLQA